MRIIFPHIILICSISNNIVFTTQYLKPNFIPYCTTRDKCRPDCSCEVNEQCTVEEFDNATRESIINYLNQLRDIHSGGEPVPAGMTMLQYDENLETISKCWAARCENQYSECFITPEFNETSQSVARIEKKNFNSCPFSPIRPQFAAMFDIINIWLGQVKVLSAETLSDLPAGEEGENLHNFAQLLSDRILKVGCALGLNRETVTFVCSYGPRGPMQGEPIYKLGELCSLCPENYACDHKKPFTRLCKEVPRSTSSFQTPPAPPPFPEQPKVTPPQPPPQPKTPPEATPVSPPPMLPQFPPTPPARRIHKSPPPVPPRLPSINAQTERMPPYLPQNPTRPHWVYQPSEESTSGFVQLPGGVFDPLASLPSIKTDSKHVVADPHLPLSYIIPLPPPRSSRIHPHQRQDPPSQMHARSAGSADSFKSYSSP